MDILTYSIDISMKFGEGQSLKQKTRRPIIVVDGLDMISKDTLNELTKTEEYQRFAFERAKLSKQADEHLKVGGSLADTDILKASALVNQYCNDVQIAIQKLNNESEDE